MCVISNRNVRNGKIALLLAAAGTLLSCGSSPPPPPDLTPESAAAALANSWAREEMNHFKVTFHSDDLVECGVKNELWKLVEVTDQKGNAWTTTYRLTDRGSKIVTAIDLKESGRGHEILLKGPYRVEVNNIADGAQPGTKNVTFRWDIDWDRAPEDLKACVPRFEMSGTQIALFQLDNNNIWRFMSYLNPEDIQAPDSGATPAQAISSPLAH